MSKKGKQWQMWVGLLLVTGAIILMAVIAINAMKGEKTGDVKIEGETKVVGLVCKDTTQVHPALVKVPMLSHNNTITANFQNDRLSSISLVYEGNYETPEKAKTAETFATVESSLILTKKYGERDDIFSSDASSNGTKMQMVQTARDISKINTNTVTYFLLDEGTSIARTLDGLKKQYEAKGFSCEKMD